MEMRLMQKKGQIRQTIGFFGIIVRLIIGTVLLYLAYLLFRYAYSKGDWEFVLAPIKSLFGSV